MAGRIKPLVFVAALLVSPAARAPDQDVVAAAKDAYGNAEYDRCVAVLESATIPDENVVAAGEYRALCLVAMDREADAGKAIGAILRIDPLYRVPGSASPRLKTLVGRVKRAALPAMVQERYNAAKAAYDNHNYKDATAGFRTVVAILEDPALDPADIATLGALKTVATGFLDLMAAVPPPAPPVPAPAPPVAPLPQPPRIFDAAEPGITAPEAIDQTLPAWYPNPGGFRVSGTPRGILEVIIDETGAVESARLITHIHPEYDTGLLRQARSWRYRPARLNGKPVKFRKLIDVILKPDQF